MASTTHFEKWSLVQGDIKIDLDLSRYDTCLQKAQYQLDGDVMASMVPFMPMVTGSFINVTRAASASVQGSGQVYAAYGPQGRFLYEGKGMVDEVTGSPWARRGARKVLVSQFGGETRAHENLTYNHSAHPGAQAHWFDAAKKKDLDKWVKNVKRIAGGG